MSNLVIVHHAHLNKVVAKPAEAALIVGFTSYLVGCALLFHEDCEFSKKELVAAAVAAGYACWKWKMGLGPEPFVNTGLENEIPRCKALERG